MLKIESQKKDLNESNQDVYDAMNRKKLGVPAAPMGNPLDDLEQFEMPAPNELPDVPSPDVPTPNAPYRQGGYEQSPIDVSDFSIPQTGSNVSQPQVSSDYIQQIAEGVIEEKWDDLMSKVGDIRLWKDKIDNDITSIKQEIVRTQNHFENLQKAVLGKVGEYNENIININTEMKALEKVFEKIIQPLTSNIKELDKITNRLKTKKV